MDCTTPPTCFNPTLSRAQLAQPRHVTEVVAGGSLLDLPKGLCTTSARRKNAAFITYADGSASANLEYATTSCRELGAHQLHGSGGSGALGGAGVLLNHGGI